MKTLSSAKRSNFGWSLRFLFEDKPGAYWAQVCEDLPEKKIAKFAKSTSINNI